MTEEERLILEQCEVRCPRCGRVWETSLLVEWCNCLFCETRLVPKKHVVAAGENEVN